MSEQNHTPEPFGYFKAQPFGWTDCAETDEYAIPLYDIESIKSISKSRDSFKDAAAYNRRRAEDAERQRDELLAACQGLLKAHRITIARPPKTVKQAENQLDAIRNAVAVAEAAISAAKGGAA